MALPMVDRETFLVHYGGRVQVTRTLSSSIPFIFLLGYVLFAIYYLVCIPALVVQCEPLSRVLSPHIHASV